MNLKDRIFSLFKYKSPEKHDFVLLEDDESDKSSNSSQSIKNDTNIPYICTLSMFMQLFAYIYGHCIPKSVLTQSFSTFSAIV